METGRHMGDTMAITKLYLDGEIDAREYHERCRAVIGDDISILEIMVLRGADFIKDLFLHLVLKARNSVAKLTDKT